MMAPAPERVRPAGVEHGNLMTVTIEFYLKDNCVILLHADSRDQSVGLVGAGCRPCSGLVAKVSLHVEEDSELK